MESKNLSSLALYAVGLAMAVAALVLGMLQTVSIPTLITFLGIGMFAIAVAGISSVSKKK